MKNQIVNSLVDIIQGEQKIFYANDNKKKIKTYFHILDNSYLNFLKTSFYANINNDTIDYFYKNRLEHCFLHFSSALNELQSKAFVDKVNYPKNYHLDLNHFFQKFSINNQDITKVNIIEKINEFYYYAYNFLLQEHLTISKSNLKYSINDIDNNSNFKNSIRYKLKHNIEGISEIAIYKNHKNKHFEMFFYESDSWYSPNYNQYSYREIAKSFLINIIKDDLIKHPNYITPILNKITIEFFNFYSASLIIDKFIKNKNLIKHHIHLIDLFDKKDISLENINDMLDAIEENHKIEKFAMSIMSSKYKFLIQSNDNEKFTKMDKKTFSLFKEIYNSNVGNNKLQDFIGKKLAGFKTNFILNEALIRLINTYNSFKINSVIQKANDLNCSIIYNNDKKLILKIYDYTASKSLGSSSWCISKEEYFWKEYAEDLYRHQYFIFDFNLASYENESLIGITLHSMPEVKISSAHMKDDSFAKDNSTVLEYYGIIKNNDKELYNQK